MENSDEFGDIGDAIMLQVAYALFEDSAYREAESIFLFLGLQQQKEAIGMLRDGYDKNLFSRNIDDIFLLSRKEQKKLENKLMIEVFALVKSYYDSKSKTKNKPNNRFIN